MLKDSMWENVAAEWVDVNNDKYPDLVIASGGNEYYKKDQHLLPLLYMNDGKGNFTKKTDAFSEIYFTQSAVTSYDFNGDGFMDLFIAGRSEPWNYGNIPRSFLLQNDGTGKFTDVTEKYSKDLAEPGMVTDAKWFDVNNDGRKDLLLCYEWGGIDAFINNKTSFIKQVITNENGWWNFILPCDVDNDGDIDFIAGNFGNNTKLKASEKEPVSMYYNDFDNNFKYEQILTYYLRGQEIPFASKQELEKQLPVLKKNYLLAEDFAKAPLNKLLEADKIADAHHFTATDFSNVVLLNDGSFQFKVVPLPFQAQLSTFRDAVVIDANNDNLPDILLAGNYYDNNVEIGRNDGDFGSVLINKGKGQFAYQQINGITLKGQVRHVKPIGVGKQKAFVLAKNNDSLMIIKFK